MALPEFSGLQRLPYELVAYVVQHLDIQDVFNLSLCSKSFQFIIREDRFCKPVVTAKAARTLEARDALETGNFSRALRRLVKRRSALSQASPYFMGVVAHADSYGFFNGKLCYTVGTRPPQWLRILDIHKLNKWELAVHIPTLARLAFTQEISVPKYKFRVLYEAAGIVSCLFTFTQQQTENWLLFIEPQEQRILGKLYLESTAKLFVRNNENFLYVGTHSGLGADGFRKWVIRGFDLNTLSWLPQPRMYLYNMAGCGIGSTVCFEIFGDYFYGLSNQTLLEADDPDWRSDYYCFRFPLHNPCIEKMQVMRKEDSWRRQHSEGPIDDRWGFMSLETDEATGDIVILECRKEWLRGQSGSRRTYYTTNVVFHQEPDRVDTASGVGDDPQFVAPIPVRPPCSVHAGDDNSAEFLLARSKTYFCAYIRYCHTFIDLIDDTTADTSHLPRLRIRAGHRRLEPHADPLSGKPALCTPWFHRERSSTPPVPPPQANTIFTWPPEKDPLDPNHSRVNIQDLLDIKGRPSCVTATGDERSLIYATSEPNSDVKTIVFLSFDPAARFDGMELGGNVLGQRISHDDSRGDSALSAGGSASPNDEWQFSPNVSLGAAGEGIGKADGTMSIPSFDTAAASSEDLPPPIPSPAPEEPECWVCYATAMHLTIQKKFFFAP